MDFYKSWRPESSPRHLVRVGQWTSFIALVVAVLWAPLIGKFASLVAYYQEFSSYLAPPIVGTFLVGLFWKGSTRNGAFAGLMSGLAMSALIMTYSVLVNIIVSKCDRNKETDVETYTWNKSVWQDDTRELKTVPWYKNFRYISIALIIIALLEYWWFF